MSILIADSGSTKTDWAYIGPENNAVYFRTAGLNPYFVSEGFFEEVLRTDVAVKLKNAGGLKVFFYGAGCGSSANSEWVSARLALLNGDSIEVSGDLLGAARATLQQRSGVACILGTGANAGFYENGEILTQAPSLGYVLGDEGGGAWLGAQILQAFLRDEMPAEIMQAFRKSHPAATRDEILRHIYRENTPNRYLAQFAKFAAAHRNHEWINALVIKGFDLFFEKYVLPVTQKACVDIGFTGSLAVTFAETIRGIAGNFGCSNIIVESSPVKGLVKYHTFTGK